MQQPNECGVSGVDIPILGWITRADNRRHDLYPIVGEGEDFLRVLTTSQGPCADISKASLGSQWVILPPVDNQGPDG